MINYVGIIVYFLDTATTIIVSRLYILEKHFINAAIGIINNNIMMITPPPCVQEAATGSYYIETCFRICHRLLPVFRNTLYYIV